MLRMLFQSFYCAVPFLTFCLFPFGVSGINLRFCLRQTANVVGATWATNLATLPVFESEMTSVKELLALGQEIGLSGDDLGAFIKEQQDKEQEERQLERERKKEQDEWDE